MRNSATAECPRAEIFLVLSRLKGTCDFRTSTRRVLCEGSTRENTTSWLTALACACGVMASNSAPAPANRKTLNPQTTSNPKPKLQCCKLSLHFLMLVPWQFLATAAAVLTIHFSATVLAPRIKKLEESHVVSLAGICSCGLVQ